MVSGLLGNASMMEFNQILLHQWFKAVLKFFQCYFCFMHYLSFNFRLLANIENFQKKTQMISMNALRLQSPLRQQLATAENYMVCCWIIPKTWNTSLLPWMILMLMLNHLSNIPVFKTTIPTTNPHTIHSFPVNHFNHQTLQVWLEFKSQSLERIYWTPQSTFKMRSLHKPF